MVRWMRARLVVWAVVGLVVFHVVPAPHYYSQSNNNGVGGGGCVLVVAASASSTEESNSHTTDPVVEEDSSSVAPPPVVADEAHRPPKSDSAAGIPQMCRDDGGVTHIPDPRVAMLVDASQAACHCRESNTLDRLLNFQPPTSDTAGLSDVLTMFNDLIANLRVDAAWHCRNACATCFPSSGDCAVVDVQFHADFRGAPDGLSIVSLLGLATALTGTGGGGGALAQLLTGQQTLRVCSEFTGDSRHHAGTVVCLQETAGVEDAFHREEGGGGGGAAAAVSSDDRPCVLEYNGRPCASCRVTPAGCVVADCREFVGYTVDTCRPEDPAEGKVDTTPFQLLPYYGGTRSASELTMGLCGTSRAAAPSDEATTTTTAKDEL